MIPLKIFLSYSRVDASDFTIKLANDLRNAGTDVWIDQKDIGSGKRWDIEIENALRSADYILFIISERSVTSDNVLDEVYFALDEKKTVIPIVYQNHPTPYRVRRLHQVDFTRNYESAFKRLCEDLRLELKAGIVEVKKEERGQKGFFERKNIRYVVVGTMICLAIVTSIVVTKHFYAVPSGKSNATVQNQDSSGSEKASDWLSNTDVTGSAEKLSVAQRITQAKIHFDQYKTDSGIALLYNKQTKKFICNDDAETFDSCTVNDYKCYYKKGLSYFTKKYFIGAFLCFAIGAEEDPRAMCMLANMYYSGNWVTANFAQAKSLYETAAENNNSVALLMLGIFHLEGKVIPKNRVLAIKYFDNVVSNDDNQDAKALALQKLKELNH